MQRLLPLALAVVLAACSPAAPATTAPTPGKYEQTWTVSYSETTCTQWADEMNDHERFVMAGDMLLGARKGDGDGSLPSDALIGEFQDAIQNVCANEGGELGVKVAETAASIYVLADDLKP